MPSEAEVILADATKAVNWIHSMGAVSLAARRAWMALNKLLKLAAQRVGGATPDLISSPPELHGGSADPSTAARSFDLNTWVPMSTYSTENDMNDPLYGDMRMGGMDHFGFQRLNQDEPFFPSASEMGELANEQTQQGEDHDQEMWQAPDDPNTWYGFGGGPFQQQRGL